MKRKKKHNEKYHYMLTWVTEVNNWKYQVLQKWEALKTLTVV